jgi:hypothetical protein
MTKHSDQAPHRHLRVVPYAFGLAVSCLAALALAAPAQAAFGVSEFDGVTVTQSGSPSTQAGAHPYAITTRINYNRTTSPQEGGPWPDGQPQRISVGLPVGFTGNPSAAQTCEEADLEQSTCPVDSQVGFAAITFASGGEPHFLGVPIFNMEPASHQAAQFAFKVLSETVHLDAHLRSGTDYGVTIDVPNVPQALPILETALTFWGVPADPSHDPQRGPGVFCGGEPANPLCFEGGRSAGVPPTAFLRNPTTCSPQPLVTTLSLVPWDDPAGPPVTSSFSAHDGAVPPSPVAQTGCRKVPFTPSIAAHPTSVEADSPTGLVVSIELPQVGLRNPVGLGQSDLRKTVVTLPEGMAVNPSSADGLTACSNSQIGFLPGVGSFTPDAAACPDSSKLGSVEIQTPLLDHPLRGGVYLARQGENKFGSLLAIYLAVDDPQTGVVVKLPGSIAPDGNTGRLVATFDETPQLPFEELKVEFFGGQRASLVNPPSCGKYELSGEFTPWSETTPISSRSSFQVSQGPNGKLCPTGSFAPKLSAGTASPLAGAYSPFFLDVSREDGTQRLATISAKPPAGLLGKLAGIPYCSEAALSSIPTAEGTGAAELGSPSCPAASQIGTLSVGAGAGSSPFQVDSGRVYLAGPYRGAPLSMVFVTPALAGPFDLGIVVVRAALQVNPESTQITAVSDPLPTILDGIPLDLRSVLVSLDRPDFILNPTSCRSTRVESTIAGAQGATASPSAPFQAAGCGELGFKPKLALQFSGAPTHRGGHPKLKAVVTTGKGDANIAGTVVTLPKTELLENAHIQTVCTRPQYAANQCPAKSIYGYARAWTPLLDKPLQGPVYLRSNGGERRLPDLVASLGGQIHVDLAGYIDSVDARIRTRFTTVPDAPVDKFELTMSGGKKGLLVNNTELCKTTPVANVKFSGQNGKTHVVNSAVKVACGKNGK